MRDVRHRAARRIFEISARRIAEIGQRADQDLARRGVGRHRRADCDRSQVKRLAGLGEGRRRREASGAGERDEDTTTRVHVASRAFQRRPSCNRARRSTSRGFYGNPRTKCRGDGAQQARPTRSRREGTAGASTDRNTKPKGRGAFPTLCLRKSERQRRGQGVSGTGVIGPLPSIQENRLSTTRLAIASRVGPEAEPTCGSSTALSSVSRASGTCGSFSKTSSPAARILPVRERRDQRRLVDQRAARDIDEHAVRTQRLENLAVDDVPRPGAAGRGRP